MRYALRAVCYHINAIAVCQCRDFLQRLHGTEHVGNVSDRDRFDGRMDRFFNIFNMADTLSVNRNVFHLDAVFMFQTVPRQQVAGMLGFRCENDISGFQEVMGKPVGDLVH